MADKDHNPFKALKKKQFPKKRGQEKPEAAKPAVPEPPKPKNDEDLFFAAMRGVEKLGTDSGREVPVESPLAQETTPVREVAESPDQEAAGTLMDLVSGKVEFALEFTDEFIQGHVKGTDIKILNQLKNGRYSPEAHLDLHGMNALQAYTSLVDFIREHYLQGRRCLLLIPGRGKNSPEGFGVLREKVQEWLTRDPLKRAVLAFCTALPKHGGAGALYVLLRRQKKSQGKIFWERSPQDLEFL